MRIATIAIMCLAVGLVCGTYGGFVWGSHFLATNLSTVARQDREDAATRAVWNWLKSQSLRPDTVSLDDAQARDCMLVKGQFRTLTADGEQAGHGAWFVVDTTVVPMTPAMPPQTTIPDEGELNHDELREVIEMFRKENAVLRELYRTVREKCDQYESSLQPRRS